MKNVVIEAGVSDYADVAHMVANLLVELEPGGNVEHSHICALSKELLNAGKIWAFLAQCDGKSLGVITLHECAAIYAGGVFGEISELYVLPEARSLNIGEKLIDAAVEKAKALGWKRLEVGTPPEDESPRTLQFYKRLGFKATGTRMKYVC